MALSAGVAEVRDSIGTNTVSAVGGELGLDQLHGAWVLGTGLRVWVIPADRGVSGLGMHALGRVSHGIGEIPGLELRGAVGLGLSTVSVQRSALDERSALGLVYELGITYEHRFRADAGVLFSFDAVRTVVADNGGPRAQFPILAIGVGLRRHWLEQRSIPVPGAPRPVPVPGRWPWPRRPEE
jgi:hypothetical protein